MLEFVEKCKNAIYRLFKTSKHAPCRKENRADLFTDGNSWCYDIKNGSDSLYKGGVKMSVGILINERLDKFGMTREQFVKASMLDEAVLNRIFDNSVSPDQLDYFDLSVISNVLFCTPEYFLDPNIRSQDVVSCCFNRGEDTHCSNITKAKLQSLVRDIAYLHDL